MIHYLSREKQKRKLVTEKETSIRDNALFELDKIDSLSNRIFF